MEYGLQLLKEEEQVERMSHQVQSTFQASNQADLLPTSTQSPGHSPQPSPDSQQRELGTINSTGRVQSLQNSSPTFTSNIRTVNLQLVGTEALCEPQLKSKQTSQNDHMLPRSGFLVSHNPMKHQGGPAVALGNNLTKPQQQNVGGSSPGSSFSPPMSMQRPTQQHNQHPFQKNTTHIQHQNFVTGIPSPRMSVGQPKQQPSHQAHQMNTSSPSQHSHQKELMKQAGEIKNNSDVPLTMTAKHSDAHLKVQQSTQLNEQHIRHQTLPGHRSPNQVNQRPQMATQFQQSPLLSPGSQNRQRLPVPQHNHNQHQQAATIRGQAPTVRHVRPSPHQQVHHHQQQQVVQHQQQQQQVVHNQNIKPSQSNRTHSFQQNTTANDRGNQSLPSSVTGTAMYEEEDYYDDMNDEDYEDMEEDYPFEGEYGYQSSDSGEISEEEASLFEELANLPPNNPRYNEIVNRLKEKGVDPAEIDEIVNPQGLSRYPTHSYGSEAFDDMYDDDFFEEGREEEYDEEQEGGGEGTVSSSTFSQGPGRVNSYQQGNQSRTLPPISGSNTNSVGQVENSFDSTSQQRQINHSQLQLQKAVKQPIQSHQHSSGQHLPPQKQLSNTQAQFSHTPQSSSSLPLSSSLPHTKQNNQLQQPQKLILGLASSNQSKKVFQSPVSVQQGTVFSSGAESLTEEQYQQSQSLPTTNKAPQQQSGPNAVRHIIPKLPGEHVIHQPVQLENQKDVGPRHPGAHQQFQQQSLMPANSHIQALRGRGARVNRPALRMGMRPKAPPRSQRPPQHMRMSQPRTFTPPGPRAMLPRARHPGAAAQQAPSKAVQSRLQVEQMQEMLDKQILAKKGIATSSSNAVDFEDIPYLAPIPNPTTSQPQCQQPQQVSHHESLHNQQPLRPAASQLASPVRPPLVKIGALAPATTLTSSIRLHPPASQLTTHLSPRLPGNIRPRHIATISTPGLLIQSPQQQLQMTRAVPPQVRMPSPQIPLVTQSDKPLLITPQTPQNLAQQNKAADINKQLPNQTQQNQPQSSMQAQPIVTKPVFNLGGITQDKCTVSTSSGKKQGLVPNKLYKIKSPLDNTMIVALWNGEQFEEVPPERKGSFQSISNSAAPSGSQKQPNNIQEQTSPTKASESTVNVPPNNSNAFQDMFMQSINASVEKSEKRSTTGGPGVEKQTELISQPGIDKTNEPLQQLAAIQRNALLFYCSPAQSTYVKPLSPPDESKQEKSDEEEEDDEDDDAIFKKPFSENGDVYRVCNNCGYISKNFKRCDGCKKLCQGPVKIYCAKTKPAAKEDPSIDPSKEPGGSQPLKPSDRFREVMSKSTFYGKNNQGSPRRGRGRGVLSPNRGGFAERSKGGGLRSGMMGHDDEENQESSEDDCENMKGMKRRVIRPKGKTVIPRKRSKRSDEPVTLTISSDEDEPSSTSNMYPGIPQSPASSAGSESPLFNMSQINPVNAFGRFRRVRMEDEEGNSKLGTKLQQSRNANVSPEPPEEELDDDETDEGDEPAVYQIDVRSVRIGSMRTRPEAPMLISPHGVCFRCQSETTSEHFEFDILCTDVKRVKFFIGQLQPVLFLFLSDNCADKLHNIFHMQPGDEEYFDPNSTDMKQKMVVVIIESFNEMPLEMLKEHLTLWADMNEKDDEDYLDELTEEAANDLLIQSTPPMLNHYNIERNMIKFKKLYTHRGENMPNSPQENPDNEPDSTSSSPETVRQMYFETPVRLLLYPPPPARGITITTEDLLCLAEGEFLNDVAIDFYLQYLYKEKMTEENRKRTHIFSSFFYKRLTQRDRHNDRTEDDAKKSLPERRHARVKKWTKSVDIFSKDFIIVPINEHSHWYLAVICFPGLANQEVVSFIPSTAHIEDAKGACGNEEESKDENTAAAPKDEGKSSKDKQPKTVFGRHVEDENDKSDVGKLIGQKQPCILMFDSLAGPSRNTNVKILKEYLQCEWDAKKSEPRQLCKIVRGSTPKVPQQSNFSDCGIFLLQYVESFFEDPIADYAIPMKGLEDWFPEHLVLNKRQAIHELIMTLHRSYMEDRGDPHILDIPYDTTPHRSHPEPPLPFPNMRFPSEMEANHSNSGSNSCPDHFLGKINETASVNDNREDDNSNPWDELQPWPVALVRQNNHPMYDGGDDKVSQFAFSQGYDDDDYEDEMEEGEYEEEEYQEEMRIENNDEYRFYKEGNEQCDGVRDNKSDVDVAKEQKVDIGGNKDEDREEKSQEQDQQMIDNAAESDAGINKLQTESETEPSDAKDSEEKIAVSNDNAGENSGNGDHGL